jgi:hypothetical protein
MILHAIAPIVLFVAFALASATALRSISGATGTYRDLVRAEVAEARAALSRANEGFTALNGYFTAVKGAVDGVAVDVATLTSSVSVRLPAIVVPQVDLVVTTFPRTVLLTARNLSAGVPGVKEFKSLVADVHATGQAVGSEIDKITSLATVPEQLREIGAATTEFSTEIRSALVVWLAIVLVCGLVVLVVWTLGAVGRILGRIRHGWALLTGQAPPAATLADLRRQLDRLQSDLAAFEPVAPAR